MTSEAGLKSECPSSLQSSGICITELFLLSTHGTLEQSTGISLAGASFWIVAAGSVGMLTQWGVRVWADSVAPTVNTSAQ